VLPEAKAEGNFSSCFRQTRQERPVNYRDVTPGGHTRACWFQ